MPRHNRPPRRRSRAQLAAAERARQVASEQGRAEVSTETLARRLVARGLAPIDVLEGRRFAPIPEENP